MAFLFSLADPAVRLHALSGMPSHLVRWRLLSVASVLLLLLVFRALAERGSAVRLRCAAAMVSEPSTQSAIARAADALTRRSTVADLS